MNYRLVIGFLAVSAALSGCKDGSGDTGPIVGRNLFVDGGALSISFPHDVTATEAAARTLRTLDPRYTIQKVRWFFPSRPDKTYNSNPLAHANIDYAHAAGLTGAGQTIAFIDEGFRQGHQEFTGKTISTPGGGFDPGFADHGTNVASIAAGSATVGDIIGVAPGADLQFGSYDSFAHMTAANNQARSLGAIVQNNSWGYDVDYSREAFDDVFRSTGGQNYLASLRELARDTVIVFAASNSESDTRADLMSALPRAMPELERTWITVVNAVPKRRRGRITGADRISAGCFEAAAWCMAADGTWTAASSTSDSSYRFVTGTSMAAPMVSGAVALLAEAFPTLSAEELRARLLASANNKFYRHTGYVAFARGVRHGYNEEYGHGFLDMRAALMPIGGSFMPVRRGARVRVDQPIVATGGMAGNALARRLAEHDVQVVDGMGAGFELPASILTAEAVESSGRDTVMDLVTGSADASIFQAFPDYIEGQQLEIDTGDTRIAVLVPANGSSENIGISVLRDFSEDLPGVSLGLTAMQESDSYVGMRSLVEGDRIGGTHVAATLGLDLPFSDRHGLQLTGTLGVAMPQGDMPAMEMSTVNFNAMGISYAGRDVMSAGDRVSMGVSLPQVVHSGVAKVVLPTARGNGSTRFASLDVPLAPEQRQVDLTMTYAVPVAANAEVSFSAIHTLNEDHISGRRDTGAGIGFALRF